MTLSEVHYVFPSSSINHRFGFSLITPSSELSELPSETHPDFPLILPSPSVTSHPFVRPPSSHFFFSVLTSSLLQPSWPIMLIWHYRCRWAPWCYNLMGRKRCFLIKLRPKQTQSSPAAQLWSAACTRRQGDDCHGIVLLLKQRHSATK